MNKAKGERGEPLTTNIPYGYKKDPDTPKGWLVDEEAAQVVKRIFTLCMEGRGPMQIAKALTESRVLTPTAYKHRQGRKTPTRRGPTRTTGIQTPLSTFWSGGSTRAAPSISRPTPTLSGTRSSGTAGGQAGHLLQYPPGHHRAEVFDKVQEIRQQRHRRTKTGKSSIFSGLVYCADCGAKMRYCTTNYFEKRQDHFVCANYRSNTGSCSAHFTGRWYWRNW